MIQIRSEIDKRVIDQEDSAYSSMSCIDQDASIKQNKKDIDVHVSHQLNECKLNEQNILVASSELIPLAPPPPPIFGSVHAYSSNQSNTACQVPFGLPPPQPPAMIMIKSRTPLYKPKEKLKKLQWDKVSGVHLKDSLWDTRNSDHNLTLLEESLYKMGVFDQIETLFLASPTTVMTLSKSTDEIRFLDNSKAQNISNI